MILAKQKFEDAFEEAKSRYKELQGVDIQLRLSHEWFFTMRAAIVPSSIFNKRKSYRVRVNLNRKDVLCQLSENDLIAWFGHELAHIIEYEAMSNLNLLAFAFKYIFNLKFRSSVEKRVNAFTYNNGFTKELFGVYRKFISLENINKKYKKYITKNYHPEWKDVQKTAEAHGITRELFEPFK